MTKDIINPGQWKAGVSGNPKGRPPRNRLVTELLRRKGEELIVVGGEEMTAQEVVAKAVWQLALHGEVSLSGRTLVIENVNEWIGLIKWLYGHLEPSKVIDQDSPEEIRVKVLRDETSQPMQSELVEYEADVES